MTELSARTHVSRAPPVNNPTKLIQGDDLDFELKDSDGSFDDDVIAEIEDFDMGDNPELQRTNRLHDALAEDQVQIKRDKAAMESTLGTKIVLSTDSQP